jgi:lipoyl(octanoyl) transferase
MTRPCIVRDLGRMKYGDALAIQLALARDLKESRGVDHLLFVEHPHVVTIGRNGTEANVLAPAAIRERLGIELFETDRGGDVTYHGPGQIVGYPIMDLRNWKRDVGAFVRGVEQTMIDTLDEFGIRAFRIPKLTGVWTGEAEAEAKVAAIGVHLSRWVSTHGFALNVTTDLRYFQHIVPCGLSRPVTSMAQLGVNAGAAKVKDSLARNFARIFDFEMVAALPKTMEPVAMGETA